MHRHVLLCNNDLLSLTDTSLVQRYRWKCPNYYCRESYSYMSQLEDLDSQACAWNYTNRHMSKTSAQRSELCPKQ